MEAVNAVLPPVCPMCGKPAPFAAGRRVDICPECMQKVSYVDEPFCLKCGKPVQSDEAEYCNDCSRHVHVYDQACSVYEYSKDGHCVAHAGARSTGQNLRLRHGQEPRRPDRPLQKAAVGHGAAAAQKRTLGAGVHPADGCGR